MLSFELRCKGKKLSKMLFCKNRQFSENTLFFSMFSAKTPLFFRKQPEFFTHFPENNPQFSQNGKIFTFSTFAPFYSINILILSQTPLQRKTPYARCAPPPEAATVIFLTIYCSNLPNILYLYVQFGQHLY